VEALAAQIRDIQQQGVLAALLKHPEIATEEQALKVREVLNQYPDFTPKDALAVARARNIELFQGKDPRGFQPGIHGSVRPNGSGAPTPETLKQQVGAIKSMTNPIDRDAAERRLHGKMVLDRLAASMGLKAKPE
jgi:hypothetical protein